MNKDIDFKKFNTGTLFLVRTPDVFPVGYAEESFADMKNNLHFDFAALLETWNCEDGILWKSDLFPRSGFWRDEERDPIEECFAAADKYEMAFLPEAGMMHKAYMEAHPEGMCASYDGALSRYGRIGLSPSCPLTLEYFVEKYDAMLNKFGHHPSCRGICMPCENGIELTYDKYTRMAWKEAFGFEMPSPAEIHSDRALERKVMGFMEERFLNMYRRLAKHLKQKYSLPLMHYPIDVVSSNSFFQPTSALSQGNIALMAKVEELDMLNLQLHPPLNPNPYFFKLEAEYLMGNVGDMPCMADTHFYHEYNAGRLLDTTPKRTVDNILSTLTPYGISFFCYGFMRDELPLWKKELNPGAPVYKVYQEPNTQKARREMSLKAMQYVEQLRPMMEETHHVSDVALYFPESLNRDYMLGSYCLEHLFGLHELLNAAAVPSHVVAEIPSDTKEVKCLVLDRVQCLEKDELDALVRFRDRGGKLMIVGKCAKEIERIAGIETCETEGRFVVSEDSSDYLNCLIRLPESGRRYSETKAAPLLCYENGEAAVTENETTLYFGISDAIDRFSTYRDFQLAFWVKQYFCSHGLNSGVDYHNIYRKQLDNHQFVSADLFDGKFKKLLLLRNYGVEQNFASLSWTLPEDYAVTDMIVDGRHIPYISGAELPVYEYFVAVLAEKKDGRKTQ